ncbi:MAG: hypothetical protein H5U19_10290 [Rhodobacteraceae bacterium]|nr:hypothetical protein [Paracoccaceae bacterium]
MLGFLARHGRLILIGGLVVGVGMPALAQAMQPLILPLIVLSLFLATLRVDPRAALPRGRALGRALGLSVLLQTALPLAVIAVFWAFGVLGSQIAIAVILTLAGAPITGSPGIAVLSGVDPAPALRQMVLGTALLPLTVVPVFWMMPVFGAPLEVMAASAKLLAMIALSGGAAIVLRHLSPAIRAPAGRAAIDGLITVVLAVVVIGLMAAVGPAFLGGDPRFWAVMAAVFVLNFALQLSVFMMYILVSPGHAAAPLAIVAGNRNLALFLGVVPPETVMPLLLFVGCYQVPMYLTPMLIGPLARQFSRAPRSPG